MVECIFCGDTRERVIVTNRVDRKEIGICDSCVVVIGNQQRQAMLAEIEYQSWYSPQSQKDRKDV